MKEIFPAGKPVSGNLLVGREKLLSEICAILDIGQSLILVAPRRYGKTSVALEALSRFQKKGHFIADIDLFDVTDNKNFAEKIIESCLKNNPVPVERLWRQIKMGGISALSMLKFRPADEDIEMILQFGLPSVDREAAFSRALDFPENFCKRYKKKMVVFMDEFQEVTKIGGNALLKKMRAKFQRHKNVTYLFAGSQESLMTEIFQSRRHAFYRFGRLVAVKNIKTDDFSPYISNTFLSASMKLCPEYVKLILEITGGHPYYTQLMCQMMYLKCLEDGRNEIAAADVESGASEVIEHERGLFDEIWSELGGKKHSRNITILIAQDESPYQIEGTSKENTARILSDLVRYGHIAKVGSGRTTKYSIRDPFFKKYVLSKLE